LPAATGAEDVGRPGAAEGDAAATAGDADGATAAAGEGDGPVAAGEAGGPDAPAAPGEGPVAGCGWAALGTEVGGEVVLPLHAASKPVPPSTTAALAVVSKWRRLMCIQVSA
jgi:hypothetical protein